jgi:hypothetical protein
MAADTAEAPPETELMPEAPAEVAKGSAKDKDAKKAGKAEKGKRKGEKGNDEKSAAQDAGADGPSIAAHPRAVRAVARAKSWGGLAGFLVGGYLSLPTNTLAGAGERALIAGIVCYLAAWAGAVFLWRRLVLLEIKSREAQVASAYAARAPRELPAGLPERQGARAS